MDQMDDQIPWRKKEVRGFLDEEMDRAKKSSRLTRGPLGQARAEGRIRAIREIRRRLFGEI